MVKHSSQVSQPLQCGLLESDCAFEVVSLAVACMGQSSGMDAAVIRWLLSAGPPAEVTAWATCCMAMSTDMS